MSARADPTVTVDRPWNQVVLAFTVTTPGSVTIGAITTAFNAQVGAGTVTPTMDFRFRRVTAWETSGANLGLQINDLVQADVDPFRTAHDEPGRNHWACCSLMWSSAGSSAVFTSATAGTGNILSVLSSGSSASILVHLELLWRFSGAVAPTNTAVTAPCIRYA